MTRARIHRLACRAAAATCGLALATSPLDMADASTRNVAACAGTTILTFTSHNLTVAGPPIGFSFSGGGFCIGLVSGPGSWSGSGVMGVASSCAVVLISGTGTMTGPGQVGPVAIDATGPSAAQTWVFFDITSPQIVAAATFAWLNQTEIGNCLGPLGTSTMTLTSILTVATA